MSEELGKLEKPGVDEFQGKRKLYFVPLILIPADSTGELLEKVNKYWDEIDAHVSSLEAKLGAANKVYHELIPAGGEKGTKAIEELSAGSHRVIKMRLDAGAELQALEDVDLLTEFMDWGKCLASGLQNMKVFSKVYEFYEDAQKRRNEFLSKQIDVTLKASDIGILLMREGHQLQFPPDMQVFYVAPPSLDQLKRWLRDREAAAPEGR